MGKTVVVTTQVPNEGSNIGKYQVGHFLKQMSVLDAYDMTTEAIVAKLMWALGVSEKGQNLRERFYMPIQFDILQAE